VEEQNPPENQSFVVVDLAQCYCYKRQFAEEELGWSYDCESILHLFSHALQLNVFGSWWGGAQTRPGSFAQFFWWMPQFSRASRNVQIAGLAAICWAIWKTRNKWEIFS
jgi:hypothetical protein